MTESDDVINEVKIERDTKKKQYEEYRNRAIDLADDLRCNSVLNVRVYSTANVQVTEEGAFVEAVIWLGKIQDEK